MILINNINFLILLFSKLLYIFHTNLEEIVIYNTVLNAILNLRKLYISVTYIKNEINRLISLLQISSLEKSLLHNGKSNFTTRQIYC